MKNKHLNILWMNADPITAEHMLLMYSNNSLKMKMWDKLTIIIWGATSKLVANDPNIQKLIKEAQDVGVEFLGCIACAKSLETVDKLTELGIELLPMGKPLTELIQNDAYLISV